MDKLGIFKAALINNCLCSRVLKHLELSEENMTPECKFMYQDIYCRECYIIVFYIGLQNYKLFIVVSIMFILFCLTMINIYISSLSISWMYKVLVYRLMNDV